MRRLRRITCVSEQHLVLARDVQAMSDAKQNPVRKIRNDDRFASGYLAERAHQFLARGEVGIGYYDDGCVVAFLWIKRGDCIEHVGREAVRVPSNCRILRHFVVAERFQGQGIGGFLLKSFAEAAGDSASGLLIAFVRKGNMPSLRAFYSAGFREIGRISSRRIMGFEVRRVRSDGVALRLVRRRLDC